MTETGAPPPSPSNSAERAKLIAERTRGDMSRETQDIGRDKKDRQPDRQIRAESERLPPKTENQPAPQKIDGQVEQVRGDIATIRTDSGEVKIRIPEDAKLRTGQQVSVEIPPQSRSGDTITIRIEAPPAERPHPAPPRPDFPPLKNGDTVIATPGPVVVTTPESAHREAPPPTTAEAKPQTATRFTPDQLAAQLVKTDLPAGDKVPPLPLPSGVNATQINALFTTRFTLDPTAPPQQWLNANVTTSLNTAVLAGQTPSTPQNQPAPQTSPTVITDDDNALTQMARSYSQKAETEALSQMTKIPRNLAMSDTAFSTLTQNAATAGMAEGSALLQNLFNTAPAAQPAAAIKTFFQIEVLRILPPDMPLADIQKQVSALITQPGDKPAMPSASEPVAANNQSATQATLQTGPSQTTTSPVLANVIGTTNAGQTLITVPNNASSDQGQQLLHIQTPITIPAGTQMLVNLTPVAADALQAMPDLLNKLPTEMATQITTQTMPQAGALPPPLGQPALAPTWPALQESLNVLQQTAPQVAQAVQNALPSPSPRMVSTALFFLAALKMGGIDSWLGEKNIDSLKNTGKSGLADRLAGDFGRIASQASETLSGQWKAITLPMLYDGQVENLQFFVRSEDSKQDDTETDQDDSRTRFILNLELSKIGPLQLDGYLATGSLDVILRTDHRMDSHIRQDLMRIFGEALETINLKGGLSFQNRPDDWVHVLPDQTQEGFFI
ncbi:MAG: hypothetical protein ACQEQL_00910 [Pseudomonadota bacterium]